MAPADSTVDEGSASDGVSTLDEQPDTMATPAVTGNQPITAVSDPAAPLPAGGPLASRAIPESPASAGSAPAAIGSVAKFHAEPPVFAYARHAKSPLPYLAAAVVAGSASVLVVRWAVQPVNFGRQGGWSLQWWDRVAVFFLQAENLHGLGADHARLAWASAILLLLGISLVLLTRRIGQNSKADEGYFGAILATCSLFAWWDLPSVIGHQSPAYGEERFRLALAAMLVLIQFIFARWAFAHKLWRSGGLPLEPIAFLLWVPQLVATFWYAGSLAYTKLAVGKHGHHHSPWRDTPAIDRLWQWSTRGTGAAIAVLIVVVTVIQHVGIRADRAAEAEYKGVTI